MGLALEVQKSGLCKPKFVAGVLEVPRALKFSGPVGL